MGIKKELREIEANLLSIDPKVQRQVDPRRVAKIAKNWNSDLSGVITVSHRVAAIPGSVLPSGEPEEFVILDGQTRWHALKQVCGTDTTTCTLLAEIFTGLTLKEEAVMFLGHNDRKGVTPLDTFRLALVAEEQWAVDIQTIALKYRWAVSGTDVPGVRKFSAIGAARKIYNADGKGAALERVFQVIDASWPRDRDTVCSETLHGLGGIYGGYSNLDTAGFVTKLGKIGFNKFYSSVHDTYRAHPSMNLAQAAFMRAVEIYNSGRRTRRIEF